MTLGEGPVLCAADLQLRPGTPAVGGGARDEESQSPAPPSQPPTGQLADQLEGVERQAILDALEASRWNRTAAAQLLGMTFRQLRYRIKKLGLDDSP